MQVIRDRNGRAIFEMVRVRFYAGVPVRLVEGRVLHLNEDAGTLVAIDDRGRTWGVTTDDVQVVPQVRR